MLAVNFVQIETVITSSGLDLEVLGTLGSDDATAAVHAFYHLMPVGSLKWLVHDGGGEVVQLFVHAAWRRKGVATVLWQIATASAAERGVLPPRHSAARTADGDAFARSVGGDLPELVHLDDLTDDDYAPVAGRLLNLAESRLSD